MVCYQPSLDEEQQITGQVNQKRDSKPSKLSQLLDMQQVIYREVMAADNDAFAKSAAVRAWDVIEDRIRILRGKVKPGSRNVSVRELAPGESTKRLPKSRGSASDYLADAARVLAEAERATAQSQANERTAGPTEAPATSAPPQPANE